MPVSDLAIRFREVARAALPLPAAGCTAERLLKLFEVGREDLSLAKLAEAHWDAVAILAEAGREAHPGALYAVWASEIPGNALQLHRDGNRWTLSGTKMFCSGADLVDRALMTVTGPEPLLVDLDLRQYRPEAVRMSLEPWCSLAFKDTNTATATFHEAPLNPADVVGGPEWYLRRTGFWQGALGPAACWAGGAAGLTDDAHLNPRRDPHTLAHLGAMAANVWALEALLKSAGDEIDAFPDDTARAQALALKVRHLVEQLATDTLRRFARAYGPYPLACDAAISRRYQELDLFLRQCHAERDLEALGALCKAV